MSKVRIDVRSKELPRGGSSMAASFETSVVNITSKCIMDPTSREQRKIEIQVNQLNSDRPSRSLQAAICR